MFLNHKSAKGKTLQGENAKFPVFMFFLELNNKNLTH